MPQTLQYRPTLIDGLISAQRISSYQQVFKPSNDVELMGVYLWNSHVCGAIFPLVAAAEIMLRNAIDQALRAHLGNFWWAAARLRYSSFTAGTPPPYAVKGVIDNFVKATNKYKQEQRSRYNVRGHVVPNHHGVVAKTEFSTWGFLLDDEFMGNHLIWPSRLGSVFAGPWPSTHASTVLSHARDLVTTVRDFRNRLFHHEPAWKRFGVRTEAQALAHLLEKIGKIESLVALVHPEGLRLLERNGLMARARRACTSTEIRRFQHLAQTHVIGPEPQLEVLIALCHGKDTPLLAKLAVEPHSTVLISPP
jgi:hypothetical protein